MQASIGSAGQRQELTQYFCEMPSRLSPDSLIRQVDCETPKQFLDALSRRKFRGTRPGQWIFRGHADDDTYRLVPSVLRENSASKNKDQRFFEIRKLDEFFRTADSVGLFLPEDTQVLRKDLRRAKHSLDPWPASAADSVLSLMALAQHHRVPTRLLDWSRHPLKAALFAASDVIRDELQTGQLSVWAFPLDFLDLCYAQEDRRAPPFALVTAPGATNSNLRAQEGVFTLAQHVAADESPVDRSSLDERIGEWIAREKTSPSPNNPRLSEWIAREEPLFHRVTLPKREADHLCWELAHEGITMANLFPDFAGVVAAMKDMDRWLSKGIATSVE